MEQLRETITQWVEAEKTISLERSTFETQREQLGLRTTLVQLEIKNQREVLVDVQQKRAELAEQKRELEKENRSDIQEQKAFAVNLQQLEQHLLHLKPKLPPHLNTLLAPRYVRLQSTSDKDMVTNFRRRLQLSMEILTEIDGFSQKTHLLTETINLGAGPQDVRVLYVGCARAFYMTSSGKEAGVGMPSEEGWVWMAGPEEKNAIVQAMNESKDPRRISALFSLPVLRSEP